MEVKRNPENGLGEKRERKILVGILAGLCVVALTLGVVVVVMSLNTDSSKQVSEENGNEIAENNEVLDTELNNYMNEMEIKIENAGTSEKKAELLIERAKGAHDICSEDFEGYKDAILSDAYTAEQISPSAESAYLIYKFESELGNKEFANQYLELARERGMNVENMVNE